MTGSPIKPEDDRLPKDDRHNHATTADDQMTPRLFRLRDLHPSKTSSSAVNVSTADIPPSVAPLVSDAVDAHHQNPRADALIDQSIQSESDLSGPFRHVELTNEPHDAFRGDSVYPSSGSVLSKDQSTAPMGRQTVTANKTERRSETQLHDAPAGRSWMETVIGHRKVLILLTIAVGAAIWTGRGGESASETDPLLASDEGSLNFDPTEFDVGEVVSDGLLGNNLNSGGLNRDDLNNDHMNQAPDTNRTSSNLAQSSNVSSATNFGPDKLSSGAKPTITNQAAMNVGTGQGVDQRSLAFDSLAPTVPASTNRSGLIGNTALDIPNNAVAADSSVNSAAGSPNTSRIAMADMNRSSDFTSSAAQAAGSPAATGQFDAQPVSSRTPMNPSIAPPSLEDLESAAQAASVNQTAPNSSELISSELNSSERISSELSVRPSPTPTGVADWLKYLPPAN